MEMMGDYVLDRLYLVLLALLHKLLCAKLEPSRHPVDHREPLAVAMGEAPLFPFQQSSHSSPFNGPALCHGSDVRAQQSAGPLISYV
jgi:hypothetical protein